VDSIQTYVFSPQTLAEMTLKQLKWHELTKTQKGGVHSYDEEISKKKKKGSDKEWMATD